MVLKKANREIIHPTVKMLLVLTLSTLCSFLITRYGMGKESIIMVFLLGVLFVTVLTSGYIYGLIASVASVILFNFFFTEPRYTFFVYSPMDTVLLLFFLATAIVSGTVTSRLQKQMSISYRNEMTARMLYEVAEGFLHVTGKRNIIMRGIRYIYNNTGLESHVVLDGDDQKYFSENYTQDTERVSIPIQGVMKQKGSINVNCRKNDLSFQQDLVLKSVAAQLGIALDRESNYQEREEIRIAMEREHLRGNLLRSIAHDLRSPLTALSGASSLLADSFDKLSIEDQKKLASDISEEIIWLTNLVENILNMTRIGEGQLVLHKEDEVVDDVVNDALSHMSRVLQGRHLDVSLPDEVISAPMDGKLIVQVLVNLLDNAVKHTPPDSSISLKVYVQEYDAIFEVSDSGKGIDMSAIDKLFSGVVTRRGKIVDGKSGMGLGLAICKAIVEAHGGKIQAQNQLTGGARFVFSLPMEVNKGDR